MCDRKLKLLPNIFPWMLIYKKFNEKWEFSNFLFCQDETFCFSWDASVPFYFIFSQTIWQWNLIYDHLLSGLKIISQSDGKVYHGTNFIFKFKHPECWSDRSICNVLCDIKLFYFWVIAQIFAVLVDMWGACKSREIHAGFPYVSNIIDNLARVVIRLYCFPTPHKWEANMEQNNESQPNELQRKGSLTHVHLLHHTSQSPDVNLQLVL